ncbi:hypothetical protein NLI96_g12909 [Meripilus lineatus]|uniref:Uncharacterized protein n=1 Tax=Meripilus lineatus TaxID=2056292 RepID=A0AAD5Y766_9APHY|nr:hypothetical protein NLI96_g12909 [Physisporinus lineatus]
MPRDTNTNVCPSCQRAFQRSGSLQSHIKQAPRCQWVLKSRFASSAAADLDFAPNPSPPPSPTHLDKDGDVPMLDLEAPTPSLPQMTPHIPVAAPANPSPSSSVRTPSNPHGPTPASQPNPSASSSSQTPPSHHNPNPGTPPDPPVAPSQRGKSVRQDAASIVKHPTAGKVFGRSKSKGKEKERSSKLSYAPFANRLDWEIAKWAKEAKIGDNKLNRLLEIKGVVEALGLSYSNARALNQIIDHDLPSPCSWNHTSLLVTPAGD